MANSRVLKRSGNLIFEEESLTTTDVKEEDQQEPKALQREQKCISLTFLSTRACRVEVTLLVSRSSAKPPLVPEDLTP